MILEFLIGFTLVFLLSIAFIGIALMIGWKIADWFEG